jgi:predicted SnoaL-like aldol condensation-catalyzing enzyme
MRRLSIFTAIACVVLVGCNNSAPDAPSEMSSQDNTERNKRLAREFYENLWFNDNTEVFADYVADEYVIHDIGDTKGAMPTEPAVAQKEIADLFHGFGELTGEIDYQIAEGDKVATRWFIYLDPNDTAEAMGFTAVDGVPIVNVFRFDDEGKIVEIWNHRHDVSLPQPPAGSGRR